MKSRYDDIAPFLTKDGSEIRELMHPSIHGNVKQSLAEATIPSGTYTLLHRHLTTEEIYHVTAGIGFMVLGETAFEVTVGDTILIPPGVPHRIEARGIGPLRVLCCCSPAYSDEDTELLE